MKIPFTLGLYCEKYSIFFHEQQEFCILFQNFETIQEAWEKKKITARILLFKEDRGGPKIVLETWSFSQSFALPFAYDQMASSLEKFSNEDYYVFQHHGLHKNTLQDPKGRCIALRKKEASVLAHLMAREETYTKEDLLASVWNYEDLCTHTLEAHLYSLRKKILQDSCAPFHIICKEGIYYLQ
jgi:hypothetical protein